MKEKNSKSKVIRAWKKFEVGALYRYVNPMHSERHIRSTALFYDISKETVLWVYPDEVFVFLEYRLIPWISPTDRSPADTVIPHLCFLQSGTGKVVACKTGDNLFHKLASANEQE